LGVQIPVTQELVSVIVLNFNGENIIGQCLDHLLAQTYPEFEIIVVDNASSDGSLAILEGYLTSGKVSVVRSGKNLGVPGGRNLGLLYAQGEVVAFMDNDGYASPTWVENALRALESDDRIGAVASLVFFNKKKIILNGAGGTINLRGYGGDLCFNTPYEFAKLPHEVLYPMGCGMVIRKSVMDKIGPLDAALFNYFDDVELGIRVWKSGFRVLLAPDAWVNHDFSYSDRLPRNKVYLCERNRIRTVLKYYPARRLASWCLREWRLFRDLRSQELRKLPFQVWAWNVWHLGSALKWRFRFRFERHPFWHLLHPSWSPFPPPAPNNQAYRPDPSQAGSQLILDGTTDSVQLNFGWHCLERDGPITYRWTEAHASAFVRFKSAVRSVGVNIRTSRPGQRPTLALRRLGERDPALTIPLDDRPLWQERIYPSPLGSGAYELLLSVNDTFTDASCRTLGVAVSSIRFD
jgi:GT2 family glycosyltransferase